MAENQILPFAQGQGANVLSQADYAGDSMRLQGHQPGVARSALENKALLQCSSIAAGLAQFIADGQADDVTDAKTPAEIAAMLAASVEGSAKIALPFTDGGNYIIFPTGHKLLQAIVQVPHGDSSESWVISETYYTLPVAFESQPMVSATPRSASVAPYVAYATSSTTRVNVVVRFPSGTIGDPSVPVGLIVFGK